jgi:hypothetical protein
MLMRCVSYSFPIDIWALGVILASVEIQGHICATANEAQECDQLLRLWHLFQPAAVVRGSSFANLAQQELLLFFGRHALAFTRPTSLNLGCAYGPRFGEFVSMCLQFDPHARSRAASLDSRCRRLVEW